MVLARCWLSKILTEDKILYLDIDTLVLNDLTDLWNINITNYALAGWPEDPNIGASSVKKSMNGYINAGVILMNLKFIREH